MAFAKAALLGSAIFVFAACASGAAGSDDEVLPNAPVSGASPTSPAASEPGANASSAAVTTGFAEPALTAVNPSTAIVGSAALDVTLTGTGFPNGAIVSVGAAPMPAVVLSDTTMHVLIPADHLIVSGPLGIAILSGNPQVRSNDLTLTVIDAASAVSSLEPSSTVANSSALVLVVRGATFDQNAVVTFDGNDVGTIFQSNSELVGNVPATLLRTARQVPVAVRQSSGTTAPLFFTITPAPKTTPPPPPPPAACGSSDRCVDKGMKIGECIGDFPAYRCESDGCLHLVGGC